MSICCHWTLSKGAQPHLSWGECVCRATHGKEVICVIELMAQGGCFEGLNRFLQAGLLLTPHPCAGDPVHFCRDLLSSLSFRCLLSWCFDSEQSLSSDSGCTLVVGEHLVHFLSGVPITLDDSLLLRMRLASSHVPGRLGYLSEHSVPGYLIASFS